MKHAGGRPTKYRDQYAHEAGKLCLLGATDGEMADFFNVNERTINLWKDVHPEFYHSIHAGKMKADAEVASRLYNRAMGYEHEAVKIFNDDGQPLIVPYIERFPPDTQAASLWLRNRQPAKWRDKQEIAHSGSVSVVPFDPSMLTAEELDQLEALLRKGHQTMKLIA